MNRQVARVTKALLGFEPGMPVRIKNYIGIYMVVKKCEEVPGCVEVKLPHADDHDRFHVGISNLEHA